MKKEKYKANPEYWMKEKARYESELESVIKEEKVRRQKLRDSILDVVLQIDAIPKEDRNDNNETYKSLLSDKTKYETELRELDYANQKEFYRQRILKCDDHISESHKALKDVDGKIIAAGGVVGGAIAGALIKLLYSQLRYSRAKAMDVTQYEEDKYDSDNKRNTF